MGPIDYMMQEFPNIHELKSILQGFALCDAVLMPEWEFRYYSFNALWDVSAKEEMGSVRNGEGMEAYFLFSPFGVAGKVLNAQVVPNPAEMIEAIPEALASFKAEKAFNLHNATFYMWKLEEDTLWQITPQNKWSEKGLEHIIGGIKAYHIWAEYYYEKKIDFDALSEVFFLKSVNQHILTKLGCARSVDEMQEDLSEIIGFPQNS